MNTAVDLTMPIGEEEDDSQLVAMGKREGASHAAGTGCAKPASHLGLPGWRGFGMQEPKTDGDPDARGTLVD